METVDDQHRLLGFWYVAGRDDLTRETLATGIDGGHPERIQLTRCNIYRITGLFQPVILSTPPLAREALTTDSMSRTA